MLPTIKALSDDIHYDYYVEGERSDWSDIQRLTVKDEPAVPTQDQTTMPVELTNSDNKVTT